METVHEIHEVFRIKVSPDKLKAEIWYSELNEKIADDFKWTTEDIVAFLKTKDITHGLIHSMIGKLIESGYDNEFPLTIAQGHQAKNGADGEIMLNYDTTTDVDRSKGYDFREVMRIPTAREDDKIAMLTSPTAGEDGRTVYDTSIKAKPGRPAQIKAGQNVNFDEEALTFHAAETGQVSIANRTIHVHHVYEVHEDLSLKVGNIDFLGTVIIRGDVPTGFRIKATGDIKVYGLVEGAELIADGSVYVTEGMSGVKKGFIEAVESVHIGYINQGKVKAGNSIYVDHSILHSECTAAKMIHCKDGNIIGGVISAGQSVTTKDVGNRLHTVTTLSFGVDKELFDRKQSLEQEHKTEKDNLRKLTLLKQKIGSEQNLDTKARITKLKLRKSFENTSEKIKEMEAELETINIDFDAVDNAFLNIQGTIYPNTIISFGKYRRKLKKKYENVMIRMEDNEIRIV